MMMKLSACVITKNEEKNIKIWLQSIQQIVHEMIVIDTGSTDQTVELAQKAGAQVYAYSWKNDFADAKNFALSKAKGDWILFLDADEYFSEKTIQNVPVYLQKIHNNFQIDAVNCPLIDIDADDNDRYMGTSRTVRIFRRNKKLQYEGRIHETLIHQGGILRLIEENSAIEIYHTGYSSSIIQDKLKRNLLILQAEIMESGESRRHYLYLLDCYYGLKDYDKAIYYAKKCVKEKVEPLGQESMVYRRWIDSLLFSGAKTEDLLNVVNLAIEKYPDLPEFYWNKGKFLFDQNDYSGAEKCLLLSLEKRKLGRNKGASGTFETKISFLYYLLGEICRKKGDIEKALSFLISSLEFEHYNKEALKSLYKSIRLCDPVDIIEIFQHLYDGKTKRDIEFLVSVLMEYPLDKVSLYYIQFLQNNYRQTIGDHRFSGMCSVQKYKEALIYAAEKTMQSYRWLIISAILSGKQENYEIGKTILPFSYQKALDCFFEKDEIILSEEDKNIYNTIVEEIRIMDVGYKTRESKIIDLLKAENKGEVSEEENKWFVSLLTKKILKPEDLLTLISDEFSDLKTKTLIDTAVFICNAGFEKIGLELLEKAYSQYSVDADILYAYVFLLHAYGEDKRAIGIISQVKNMSKELVELAQQIRI